MRPWTKAFAGTAIVAVAAIALFLFLPAFDYTRPGLVIVRYGCGQGCDETLNATYSAKVSLSYMVFKCEFVQNATVSYFDVHANPTHQTGQLGGGWSCVTLD